MGENLPAGHCVHDANAEAPKTLENVPLGHDWQVAMLKIVTVYIFTNLVAATAVEYVPIGQEVQ